MNEEERKVRSLLDYTFDRMEEELGGCRRQQERHPAPGKRRQGAGTDKETKESTKAPF